MKSDKKTLNFLYDHAKTAGSKLVLLTLIKILLGFSGITDALVMRAAIDAVTDGSGRSFRNYLILLILLFCLQMILRLYSKIISASCSVAINMRLIQRLFSALIHKEYSEVNQTHTGEWVNRLNSDASVVANGVVDILPNLLEMLVRLIAAYIMILIIIGKTAWLILPIGVFAIAITYFLRKHLKLLHKNVQSSAGKVVSYMQEHLENLMILKAFHMETIVTDQLQSRTEEYQRAYMSRARFHAICGLGLSGLVRAVYFLGFGYCGYGLLHNMISYGTLIAILQLVGQLQTPIANLSGFMPQIFSVTASAERLMEVDDLPDETFSQEIDPQKYYNDQFKQIRFTNVSFQYPDENQTTVLTAFDLAVKKGDYVALVGSSGKGKSTIFKLLLSIYHPVSGKIQVEDLEGNSVPLDCNWRNLFAYVPQGNLLISGSIRDAVTMISNRDFSQERFDQAIQAACADQFIKELENGQDTILGERGAGLSEGQIQRLSIARAIYSDHPILLLDEATSALDEVTERQVLINLRNMTDKTVLVVTHRPAALEICDRIVKI